MSLHNLLQVEHSLAFQTASMTRRGLLLDVDETNNQKAILDSGIVAATERLETFGLSPSVTTDEGRQALEALLLDAGCKPDKTPKSGKLKVGADDLRLTVTQANDEIKGIVNDLIFIRQAEKVKAAYLNAFLESAEYDGRVHPVINTMGARTHRMSVSQPPLQQIPRDPITVDGQKADTRGCLIADSGCLLVAADYAQIEQRVYATLAGEYKLVEAFKSGTDFHKTVASDLFSVSVEDVSATQRQLAKNAGYLMIYGGGARKLAITAGIPLQRATSIIRTMRKAQPAGNRYARRLTEQESITTSFGRVLPIDEARRYAAINYMIQSTARDLFVIGLVRLVKAGYGELLWIPEHDEIIMNVPEENAERVAKEMGPLMAIDFYGTPIVAEGQVLGKHWRKA